MCGSLPKYKGSRWFWSKLANVRLRPGQREWDGPLLKGNLFSLRKKAQGNSTFAFTLTQWTQQTWKIWFLLQNQPMSATTLTWLTMSSLIAPITLLNESPCFVFFLVRILVALETPSDLASVSSRTISIMPEPGLNMAWSCLLRPSSDYFQRLWRKATL